MSAAPPSLARCPQRAYLVGFMGCGKSTVGALLARRLGWPFADLDHEIARRADRTVAEIFAAEGEAGFRVREREALAATAEIAPVVVATGGGTIIDPASAAMIARLGRSVYLEAPLELIRQRLNARERKERPLFADMERAAELYSQRLASYRRRADLHVGVGSTTTPEALAGRIAPYFRTPDLGEGRCVI